MNHVDMLEGLCREHDIFIVMSLTVWNLIFSASEMVEYVDLAVIDLSMIQLLPVNMGVCPDCKL